MAETLPGAFTTPTIAPVYVGGIPLTELTKALDENSRLIAAQKAKAAEQFWSSPRRAATDTTREVYEVSLNASKRVNAISFDLARFPHKAYLFYRSTTSGQWLPLKTSGKRAISASITDSTPAIITPPPPGSTEHPQHYGAGHWVRKEYALEPVLARQFRLVLVRQKTASVPTDRAKKPVNYSLGVRGFEVGYGVLNRSDIPVTRRDPVVVTEREAFASTTDILGSPVSISVRENRASDLLKGAVWKCEPQPVPNAVVSLYVDARDGQGKAQTIDRFYLDPLTTGASMNLYYSNDTPDQVHFSASDNPLDFPLSRQGGSVRVSAQGLVFPDGFGYVDLDNAGVQLNIARPFWLAMNIQPGYLADDVNRRPILDNGTLRVEFNNGALQATLSDITVAYAPDPIGDGSDEEAEDPTPPLFDPAQEVSFAVGYDGHTLTLSIDGQVRTAAVPSVTVVKPPKTSTGMASYLRIGGFAVADNADPGHGFFRLGGLIVKAEPPAGEETYAQAFADMAAYVDGGQEAPDLDTSDNALLRYLPIYQTPGAGSVNPLGFIGGPGSRYEDLVWTPINRDFTLAKGYVVFNPTLAKYFKFEFTNLVAAPYDDYSPATRKVKVFPTAQVYRQAVVTSSNNTARGGATAAQDAASTLYFADQARLNTVLRPLQPSETYIPTVGVYSSDPKVAENLRAKSIYHNLKAWHASRFVPRFVDVQKHIYETIEVSHTARVAYFVGLSRIEMSRVDYATADDTEQYLDPFSDAANLVVDQDGLPVGGWTIDEGWLATPDTLGANQTVTATSKVFASRRKVTGLQFATQQTPPVQVLPDADLDDPVLRNWRGFGDARVTASDEFATDIGTMVLVQRDSSANFWDTIEDRYESWDAMEAEGLLWDDLEASGNINPQGGLAAAGAHDVSPRGRLYAAARVYATEALSAPLYVQVVGEDGRVLSEEPVDVKAGQVAEWYTSYTIGEGGDEIALTWDDIEALGDWDDVEELGTWDQVSETTATQIGKVSARIVQASPTADSWYVDNLSLFDDAIIWEFSRDGGTTWYPAYDIRNDAHGAFIFPDSDDDQAGLGLVWRVTGTRGNQRVDYLAIRPWYDSLPLGQPYRETIQSGGPNDALIDHYPPVTEDPRWKVWDKPIPEEWWFVFRQWLLEQRPEPDAASTIVVPDSIVPVDEGSPEDGYLLVANEVLFSTREGQYYDGTDMVAVPGADPFLPFSAVATAILTDGTFFVATPLDYNPPVGSETAVRMWHLGSDLAILGTFDYQPSEVGVDLTSVPEITALAIEDNKVMVFFTDSFTADSGTTVRALKVDCSGTDPVIELDVISDAVGADYASYVYSSWSVHIPDQAYVVAGYSGNGAQTHLHIFNLDGTLRSEPVIYEDWSGYPIGLYVNPSDPTEVTVALWGNNSEVAYAVVSEIDTATPTVVMSSLSAEANLNWIYAATNPYYQSPGGMVSLYDDDFEVTTLNARSVDDVLTPLTLDPNYINGTAGAADMGDRLIYGIDGGVRADADDHLYYPFMRVVDYRVPGSPTFHDLNNRNDLVQALEAGALPFAKTEGLGAGSFSMDARADLGLILQAGNILSNTSVHAQAQRYSTVVWLVQGPARASISLPLAD